MALLLMVILTLKVSQSFIFRCTDVRCMKSQSKLKIKHSYIKTRHMRAIFKCIMANLLIIAFSMYSNFADYTSVF